jgi:TPP-dependent pyruvate/acetoin dehydrogenase alpha subunit
LRRRPDGSGDVFSLRTGTAAAALAFGLEPEILFRQALGRRKAPAGGRDPGGFPTDLARGLLGPVSTPGTLVEVLAGVALAFRLKGEPRVALLVDDADGSASGFWHEGLNLAAVQRAPFVLVVDAGERRRATARVRRLSVRGAAYGVDAVTISGEDPRAVLETVAGAVERARAGGGTHLVEVERGAAEDPVASLAGRLEWAGEVGRDDVAALRAEARAEMESALARVLAEPPPDPEQASGPVLSDGRPAPLPFVAPTARGRPRSPS